MVLCLIIYITINSKDDSGKKAKYIFRTNPRDISIVYFYDPFLKEYFEIPYKDTSLPPITIWEHRDVVRKLRKNKIENIDEVAIFSAYKELKEIEQSATLLTRKEKRKDVTKISIAKTEISDPVTNKMNLTIEPFEDIE